MRGTTKLLVLVCSGTLALSGCGDSHRTVRAPSAALALVKDGDLPGLTTLGPPTPLETAADAVRLDEETGGARKGELASLEHDGFKGGSAVFFRVGSNARDSGYSEALRFDSEAAARRELRESVNVSGFKVSGARGLPHGEINAATSQNKYVARNLDFVEGNVLYFIGYSTRKRTEPGRVALEAAGRAILRRAGGDRCCADE
jgi:hypothetical protein